MCLLCARTMCAYMWILLSWTWRCPSIPKSCKNSENQALKLARKSDDFFFLKKKNSNKKKISCWLAWVTKVNLCQQITIRMLYNRNMLLTPRRPLKNIVLSSFLEDDKYRLPLKISSYRLLVLGKSLKELKKTIRR